MAPRLGWGAPGIGGRALLAAALAVWVLAACTTEEFVRRAGIPGTTTPARVVRVSERFGFLDVELEIGMATLRYFTPTAEPCPGMLRAPVDLHFVPRGLIGRLRDGEQVCDLAGILSLAELRQHARRRAGLPRPRTNASYRVFARDDELAVLRGRFDAASALQWVGADTLVVLERGPVCDELLERRAATLVLDDSGPSPLVLLTTGGRCPVLGLVRPPVPSSGEDTPADATPAEPAPADAAPAEATPAEPASAERPAP